MMVIINEGRNSSIDEDARGAIHQSNNNESSCYKKFERERESEREENFCYYYTGIIVSTPYTTNRHKVACSCVRVRLKNSVVSCFLTLSKFVPSVPEMHESVKINKNCKKVTD